MLSVGELVERVGYGFTTRRIDRLVRDEQIPYVRFGRGWVQVPAWVAGELRARAAEQLRLRERLAAITGIDTPTADAERDEIRQRLVWLEGPVVRPAPPENHQP